MLEAVFEAETPFDPDTQLCAVVLCRTEHGNFHVGLLHRAEKGRASMLHLGWRDYLSTEWPWLRLRVCPDCEPENRRLAAGYCRLIWRKFRQTRTFPYALGDFASTFDAEGNLVLKRDSPGLTCATFVMAVFRASGVELVDEVGWPVRVDEDRRWLAAIANFAHPEHLNLLRAQVEQGVARVHPHELVGACTLSPLPATFDKASTAAIRVVEKLDAAIGR